jgi:hypothetical protein
MLFLSQPVGVGFSYGSKVSFDILIAHVNLKLTKAVELDVELPSEPNSTQSQPTKGRYSTADYPAISVSHQLKLARRD